MDCLAVFNTETVNIWVSEVKLENTLVFKTSFTKHLTCFYEIKSSRYFCESECEIQDT